MTHAMEVAGQQLRHHLLLHPAPTGEATTHTMEVAGAVLRLHHPPLPQLAMMPLPLPRQLLLRAGAGTEATPALPAPLQLLLQQVEV